MSRYHCSVNRHFVIGVGVLVVLPTARHLADLPMGALAVRKEMSLWCTIEIFLSSLILDIFYT